MTEKKNVIPRHYNIIIARQERETSGGKPGDEWAITPNIYGGNCTGENQRTGERYYIFKEHLKNPAFYTILHIE